MLSLGETSSSSSSKISANSNITNAPADLPHRYVDVQPFWMKNNVLAPDFRQILPNVVNVKQDEKMLILLDKILSRRSVAEVQSYPKYVNGIIKLNSKLERRCKSLTLLLLRGLPIEMLDVLSTLTKNIDRENMRIFQLLDKKRYNLHDTFYLFLMSRHFGWTYVNNLWKHVAPVNRSSVLLSEFGFGVQGVEKLFTERGAVLIQKYLSNVNYYNKLISVYVTNRIEQLAKQK